VPEHDDFRIDASIAGLFQDCWGERRDGDSGAVWWFETVRNHYIRDLYGLDPEQLLHEDLPRYLDMSRATNAELMEAVFALWRRKGSPTAGGLVWHLRDVVAGAGWGVLDSNNRPKSVWHALRRAFRPINVTLVDDGLNGLTVHLVNETQAMRSVVLELTSLRDGATPVMRASRTIDLAPRGLDSIAACDLWGGFFDTTYAYRFGPPSHDVTCASLRDGGSGAVIAEAFHFPLGRGHERRELGLVAEIEMGTEGPALLVTTQRFAQSVHLRCEGWRASDDWFHLAPGGTKRITLVPVATSAHSPSGNISAINGLAAFNFGSRT
jgi:beta-mannosidase